MCSNTTVGIKTAAPKANEEKDFDESVQIKPQKVSLELRPGQPTSFKVSVKPAPNFPVDLYFLMDVSASLKDDLAKLQTLGAKIATEIKEITTNYRFAFGSFCDKTVIPYIQPLYHDSLFPCSHATLQNTNCRPTFGYIHFFDFSNDTKAFENVVAAQNITGDLDSPEGGFDGLMQAAVCGEVLKWQEKEKARRIVIFVTDHFPKIAGDAKLAGVITPNDGLCHMRSVSVNSTEKTYSASETMDYPSLYHLKKMMQENNVVPILAIGKRAITVYEAIANEWKDLGAAIGELTSDSSNIVELVKENYAKISSTARLVDTSPDYFKVSYQVNASSCPSADDLKPNECSDVKIGQQVDFNVNVELLSCPPDVSKAPKSFSIRIAGFGEVVVPVKYLCDCDCSINNVKNSPKCNGAGTFECGICKCNEGNYGATCQCDITTEQQVNNTNACIGSDNTTTCSDQGNCVCGQCECFKQTNAANVISGPFCECKNFGCPKFLGQECGGVRGSCQCGTCVCNEGYEGDNCNKIDCVGITRSKCTNDGKVCNNQGECDCPSQGCICNSTHEGKYCQTCVSGKCQCDPIKDCVLCQAFDQKNDKCATCEKLTIQKVDFINITEIGEDNVCGTSLANCVVNFHFAGNAKNKTIVVQKTPVCTAKSSSDDDPDILVIILAIIGAILLLGILALLLWKLITSIHDRRDYEKFVKSKSKGVWEKGDNPLYRKPNQQFVNPAFGGQ